jgi:hypothetical protein
MIEDQQEAIEVKSPKDSGLPLFGGRGAIE